jgi:hypothetical protein
MAMLTRIMANPYNRTRTPKTLGDLSFMNEPTCKSFRTMSKEYQRDSSHDTE